MWPYDEDEIQWLNCPANSQADDANKPSPGEELIPC